ncbi:DUF1853 family protein [Aporhodopirellula aestuarii]|uniref:DUF1853 family protein n=1 Tax=Aporhodopirellula aestuarii TaxID=2950107 RepID=A0ABT0TZD6_9BACT|nr:DUF1853 family protein [Aporhodopirellula aestuarii]MCM2369927.1 DUF1853 family protein [Aporhodopirellula aestuarii]
MKSGTISIHRQQLLRDLIWCVNSPSLITPAATTKPITADEIDEEHLASFFLDQVPRKVGHYFERLVLYWLTHVRRVELIANTLQIRSENRTLGEIDFLYRDEQGQLTHLEVAVKFYLYQPDRVVHDSHFIGPNVRDTFERKMHRLFEHQLPLSHRHFPDVKVRHAFVKGRIFYDADLPAPVHLPAKMSPDHLRGSILRLQSLDSLEKTPRAFYRVLEKPFWLSDDIGDSNLQPLQDASQIKSYITRRMSVHHSPVLFSELNQRGDSFTESNRLFIVPDDWPADAT